MSKQIIRQPDGKFAVFSPGAGAWVLTGATADEVADYFADEAAQAARESARVTTRLVVAGEPGKAYLQFALTFDEANEASQRHGGMWIEPSAAGSPSDAGRSVTAIRQTRPIDLRCPSCRAAPGSSCLSRTGRAAGHPHKRRSNSPGYAGRNEAGEEICLTCERWKFPAIHSCPGVPQAGPPLPSLPR